MRLAHPTVINIIKVRCNLRHEQIEEISDNEDNTECYAFYEN